MLLTTGRQFDGVTDDAYAPYVARLADRGVAGSMEGHAAMDMSVDEGDTWWERLRSPKAFTAISHIFVMEWGAVLRDIALGLLVAGALQAWVPESFWQSLFLTDSPFWSAVV